MRTPPGDAGGTGLSLVQEDAARRQATNPRTAATEPAMPAPVLDGRGSHHVRGPRTSGECSPCSAQLEKGHTQQQRPDIAKNRQISSLNS